MDDYWPLTFSGPTSPRNCRRPAGPSTATPRTCPPRGHRVPQPRLRPQAQPVGGLLRPARAVNQPFRAADRLRRRSHGVVRRAEPVQRHARLRVAAGDRWAATTWPLAPGRRSTTACSSSRSTRTTARRRTTSRPCWWARWSARAQRQRIDHYSLLRTLEDMYGLPRWGGRRRRAGARHSWSLMSALRRSDRTRSEERRHARADEEPQSPSPSVTGVRDVSGSC